METDSILRFWRFLEHVATLAGLQHQFHQVSAPESLQPQHELLESCLGRAASLPKRDRDRALDLLHELPQQTQLCHGDFHLGNVIVSPSGPVIVDWTTVNSGSPLADIAATEILLLVPIVPSPFFHIVSPVCRLRAKIYMEHCRRLSSVDEDDYQLRFLVAAAARVSSISHNAPATRAVLKLVRNGFDKL